MAQAKSMPAPPSLDRIRTRIDAIDAELLRLLDERVGLSGGVAAAKAAAGQAGFGLRPARETQVLRRLLQTPRTAASSELVVRVWREIMGASLAAQGPFHLSVWAGRDRVRMIELARLRFGATPALTEAQRPEDAIAAARTPGGVAVCAIAPDNSWWVRLLAEPKLRVFAILPCFTGRGPPAALASAAIEVEPTGDDVTFWVTDAPQPAAAIEQVLSRDGVAASPLAESGDFKLFMLAGYYQAQDERLARAPGRLSGVIGAAPAPMDA